MENTLVMEPKIIEREAAIVAMRKVVDIHNTPFYKHALSRFSSSDILDPGHRFTISPEDIDHSVDRLQGVLTAGIISDDFAKRANIQLSKNWKDPNNAHSTSLADLDTPINDAIIMGLPNTYQVRGQVNLDNTFLFLVDYAIPVASEGATNSNEVLKKIRVKPKQLTGIVLIDSFFDLPDDVREGFHVIPEYNAVENAARVKELMEKAFGQQTEKYIPIYGNSGATYWPQEMTYSEVQEYLEERKAT